MMRLVDDGEGDGSVMGADAVGEIADHDELHPLLEKREGFLGELIRIRAKHALELAARLAMKLTPMSNPEEP
jgi:hypothetical protein